MLTVAEYESLPGVEIRWVAVSPHMHPGCSCLPLWRAMVVVAEGMDLWVGAALGEPADPGWVEAVDAMRGCDGELAVARMAAAFGMPWAELTEPIVLGQMVLQMRMEESLAERIRGSSVEQLLALRERVYGGRPGGMVRALRCLRDYAAVVQ